MPELERNGNKVSISTCKGKGDQDSVAMSIEFVSDSEALLEIGKVQILVTMHTVQHLRDLLDFLYEEAIEDFIDLLERLSQYDDLHKRRN